MVSLRLDTFITETFGSEGWHQTHKDDSGNYYNDQLFGTILGITARDHFETYIECYDLYRAGRIKECLELARAFYRASEYWNDLYDEIDDVSLAFRVWDFGINAGVYTSVKLLQETANKKYGANLKKDGRFGNDTLAIINGLSNPIVRKYPEIQIIDGETEFYFFYVERLDKYYRSLRGFFKFGSGWIKRLNRIFNGLPDLYEPIKHKLVEELPDNSNVISDGTD